MLPVRSDPMFVVASMPIAAGFSFERLRLLINFGALEQAVQAPAISRGAFAHGCQPAEFLGDSLGNMVEGT